MRPRVFYRVSEAVIQDMCNLNRGNARPLARRTAGRLVLADDATGTVPYLVRSTVAVMARRAWRRRRASYLFFAWLVPGPTLSEMCAPLLSPTASDAVNGRGYYMQHGYDPHGLAVTVIHK